MTVSSAQTARNARNGFREDILALTPAAIVRSLAPIVGKVGAAGIAGNLQQESTDRPDAQGGGLAQWQGSRYTGLVKYAQSRGLPTTSAQAALGYLAQDLKGPYSGLAQQLRSAKDPAHAATLFSNIYERPGIPMLGNRINYARQALGATGGQALPALPGMQSSGAPQGQGTQTTTRQVLDQAGFNQANNRYLAGSFLAKSAKANPYGLTGPSPLFAPGLLTTKAPNPADYQKSVTTATATLQKVAGTPLTNVHPNAKGYVNPIVGAVIGRTDQGVDATLKPGAPIRALGDSKVVQITPWYKGQPLVLMQLTSGPQAGKFWYVAEQIAPGVKVGQTVRAGQAIGAYANSGTGLELGWGSPKSQHLTLATAPGHGGYSEGQVTPEGGSFRSFLGGLK